MAIASVNTDLILAYHQDRETVSKLQNIALPGIDVIEVMEEDEFLQILQVTYPSIIFIRRGKEVARLKRFDKDKIQDIYEEKFFKE